MGAPITAAARALAAGDPLAALIVRQLGQTPPHLPREPGHTDPEDMLCRDVIPT
jgi:hypothetical protein